MAKIAVDGPIASACIEVAERIATKWFKPNGPTRQDGLGVQQELDEHMKGIVSIAVGLLALYATKCNQLPHSDIVDTGPSKDLKPNTY